ncbi:MAG: hypothetical protein RLZZ511_3744, partial [Cyanobacteriota bacterium]
MPSFLPNALGENTENFRVPDRVIRWFDERKLVAIVLAVKYPVECEFGSRLQGKAAEHRHRLGLY